MQSSGFEPPWLPPCLPAPRAAKSLVSQDWCDSLRNTTEAAEYNRTDCGIQQNRIHCGIQQKLVHRVEGSNLHGARHAFQPRAWYRSEHTGFAAQEQHTTCPLVAAGKGLNHHRSRHAFQPRAVLLLFFITLELRVE